MKILLKKSIKNLRTISILFLSIILTSGCDLLSFKKNIDNPEGDSQPVARVHDSYLYESDLEGLMRKGVQKSDSANIAERYVNSWIKKQLLIKEAASQSDFNIDELEKMVQNYRQDLMIHALEKKYVENQLDREITEEEINKYYKENIENFELKQNIIKCLYVKLPNDAPKLQRVKKLINSSNPKEREELNSYTYRFSTSYSLQDSLWLNFEEVIANTPLTSIPNKVQFLKKNDYVEMSDDDFTYFLKILDYKISEETSPLEFVKDQIENIILNKRKIALTGKLEEQIYTKALNEKEFEIFKK